MLNKFFSYISRYFDELTYVLEWHWNHMTPSKYITILLTIGVFGYILMRNGVKQY